MVQKKALTIFFFILFVENAEKPQTLFFSATLPDWVETIAKKYMTKDKHIVDVIGNEKQRTALTVEVRDVLKKSSFGTNHACLTH